MPNAKKFSQAVLVTSLGLVLFSCTGGHSDSLVPGAQAHEALSLTPSEQIERAAEITKDSVVRISVRTQAKESPHSHHPLAPFFGPPPQQESREGLGSGVIIDSRGYIVTNNHVVEDAKEISVTLADQSEHEAVIMGTDPKSDLAVIRLKTPPKNLKALKLGDSTGQKLGQVVLAIGNPFGVGQTVTMGIISATGRSGMGIVDYEDFIQTDAAINPGNSGGALVNLSGELIGINTAILSRSGGYQGIGFAIPAKMVKEITSQLIATGSVSRGFLGIDLQELTPDLASAFGLKSAHGAVVRGVAPGTPAAKAKLQQGDVIIELDGTKISDAAELRKNIAEKGPDKEVSLGVWRNSKLLKIKVTLAKLPSAQDAQVTDTQKQPHGTPAGFGLAALDEQSKRYFRLNTELERGVVITRIKPDSPAAKAGLHPRDIVVEVDRKPVSTPEELSAQLSSGKTALLLVERGGKQSFVPLKP